MSFNPQAVNFLRPIEPCEYRHSRDKWKHASRRRENCSPPSGFTLITWNVDFQAPESERRLQGVVNYIKDDLIDCDPDTDEPDSVIILLQEVHRDAFYVLLDDPWLRQWFTIAPSDPDSHWPTNVTKAAYGIVTLVSKSIPVKKAMSLEFGCSGQHRNALFVDVQLTMSTSAKNCTVRVTNTHLESLAGPGNAACRSLQLRLIARYLVEDRQGAFAAILGGDLNAIDGDDETGPEHVGLHDAWRPKQNEDGTTWGPQRGRTDGNWPNGRLDKILFTRKKGFRVEHPLVMGKGVKAMDSTRWVSDHYCLMSDVYV